MWGELQGPPECNGPSCPHYLGPEDAAHALAEHAELTRARFKLAALPTGMERVLDALVDIDRDNALPEPWEAIVRTWQGSVDGVTYTVGLRRTDNDWGVTFDVGWRTIRRPADDAPVTGWIFLGGYKVHETIGDAVRYLRDDGRL